MNVMAVGPDQLTRTTANMLLGNRISAVPVVDRDGMPIGMVSEGYLTGGGERDRVARIDWRLAPVAGKNTLDDRVKRHLQGKGRTASNVMLAPPVTVIKDTSESGVAQLFAIHDIKRSSVVRGSRLVDIVSRADLLCVVAAGQQHPAREEKSAHHGFPRSLLGGYLLPAWEVALAKIPAELPPEAG